TSTFSGVYFDNSASTLTAVGSGSSSGTASRSFSQIRTQGTYSGYNFSTVWEMRSDGPALRHEELGPDFCTTYGQSSSAPFTTGLPVTPDGSSEKPYHICAPGQVNTMVGTTSLWDKHFVLEADIDIQGFGARVGSSTTPFTG